MALSISEIYHVKPMRALIQSARWIPSWNHGGSIGVRCDSSIDIPTTACLQISTVLQIHRRSRRSTAPYSTSSLGYCTVGYHRAIGATVFFYVEKVLRLQFCFLPMFSDAVEERRLDSCSRWRLDGGSIKE
eukprot:scaffold135312_cov56-Attheya_sp.AAC.2